MKPNARPGDRVLIAVRHGFDKAHFPVGGVNAWAGRIDGTLEPD